MKRLKKMTMVLPLVVILAGALVPLVIERGNDIQASGQEVSERKLGGRTAGEWAALAREAQEDGRFRQALSHIKTAERVEAGTQYAGELVRIRRARWRSREGARVRERFHGGPIEDLTFDEAGAVAGGHRTAVVLPGESLWTIATSLAAAGRAGRAGHAPDSRAVYVLWDELTGLNGVRELEVGERVKVPIPPGEVEAMAATSRADLEKLAAARSALSDNRLGEAAAIRRDMAGRFVPSTRSCLEFDEALASAREARLVDDAREALSRAGALPRLSSHRERLTILEGVAAGLREAERLTEGDQYGDALALVDTMVIEESRFSIEGDGTMVAVKPSGVSYTEAARSAVEWLLERELVSSGAEFPYVGGKTSDELAWARYLVRAADAARIDGLDFATLLTSGESELKLRLPDPTPFFAD